MMQALTDKPLFLLGQQLRELTGVPDPDERKFLVCGGHTGMLLENRSSRRERDPWKALSREALRDQAAGSKPRQRVGLVCDAGLGKTTNMQWMQAAIAECTGTRQLPVFLRFDDADDLDRVQEEYRKPDSLLDWLAAEIVRAAGGDPARHRRHLKRQQQQGRITLLLDGLDHALALSGFDYCLAKVLGSVQWHSCPVWIAGRPHAFEACWKRLFAPLPWDFVRVEPLREPEIRFYMTYVVGADWYDTFPAETQGLLAVPRLLKQICGILRKAVRRAMREGREPAAAIERLELRTPADVYYLAYFYFEEGDYDDRDSQGLLGQGLVGEAERLGLDKDVEPTEMNFGRRIERAGALLGAIAFHMYAMSSESARPEPNTTGVALDPFQNQVAQRVRLAGQGSTSEFELDLNLLRKMNNRALEYLLFREFDKKRLVFHDRTVQAFFAAHWAVKYGAVDEMTGDASDLKLMQRWIVDAKGDGLAGFDEFWRFAAEMPQALVNTSRWSRIFNPCYAPPQRVGGHDAWVEWHRRIVYHSFERMKVRSTKIIKNWRASFHALAQGTAEQRRIHQEIVEGFRPIEAGDCAYGADPLNNTPGVSRNVAAFRMHQWQVTNEMYEEFDPGHREKRGFRKHPLPEPQENRCPVVNVSWYDAWNFAAWCDCRLPTELEWEHACQAGSATTWHFGNDENELQGYAWYEANSQGSTRPVGKLAPNKNGLFDMHGNVLEWCLDPDGPGASARVLRGGCWLDEGWGCRSADRCAYEPVYRIYGIGFRLAAVPGVGAEPAKQDRAQAT